MKLSSIPTSSSVKLPELNTRQKFLITEPDDKGFAKDQSNKLTQGLYLMRQLHLKPWEKDSYNNIYKSSGQSNHQILKNLKLRIRSSKTINKDDLSKNNYYNDKELKSIDDSQEIKKQIKLNSEIRKKFNQPSPNINSYTIETKEICKNNMLQEFIKLERNKMQQKLKEYEQALKKEMKILDKDIFKFETYATNELLKLNLKNIYINNIENNRRNKLLKIKSLTQEYHNLQDEIPKVVKRINGKKIYVNFIHKLFGGEPELANCNLDDINFKRLKDAELHSVTDMVQREMDKTSNQENILQTSTEEDLLRSINKLDVVFKIMENNIMKTLAKKEKLRLETVELAAKWDEEKKILEKEIEEREKEYQTFLGEYKIEMENSEFISHSKEDINKFVRKMHIELFESAKETIIKKENDIDEYNINDKIVKPTIKEITNKERKIDSLILQMEKFSKEDEKLFNKSVVKIKNENKIMKYYEEKNNMEIKTNIRNNKILEKINKIMITGKHKYKIPIPLNIVKQKRNNDKEINNENNELKMLYY